MAKAPKKTEVEKLQAALRRSARDVLKIARSHGCPPDLAREAIQVAERARSHADRVEGKKKPGRKWLSGVASILKSVFGIATLAKGFFPRDE